MSNVRWKPLPGYPGYEINRSAWVRNERGYVVASGRGARLFVGGVYVGVRFKRLVALAAEVFGETHVRLPEPKADSAPVVEAAPEPVTVEAPVAVQEEATPVVVEEPQQTVAPKPEKPAKLINGRSKREDGECKLERYNPTRELPLHDPWANGSIEMQSEWDWAGVM